MRIIMVAPSLEVEEDRATSRSFLALWDQARRHHDVTLVAGWSSRRAAVPDAALGVRLPVGEGLVASALLTRAIRGCGRADVTLVAGLWAPGVRGAAVSWLRTPPPLPRSWAARARLRRQSARFERVIAPAPDAIPGALALGWSPAQIDLVPDGLDAAVFYPAAARATGGPQVLIAPGRIRPERGQHLAIDAVSRLDPALKAQVVLRVVGRVADQAYYHHLRAAAVGQPVEFAVDVPSMGDALRAAALALVPTLLDDTSAHPAIEALACGIPVLHSDFPGLIQATGGLGQVVAADDASAWRAAISRFLVDPTGARAMAARGARWAPLKYGWPAVWAQVEERLRWLQR